MSGEMSVILSGRQLKEKEGEEKELRTPGPGGWGGQWALLADCERK